MLKKYFSLLLFLLFSTAYITAQNITPEQYVETYKDLAIREMKRMGVPAAITLAQGLLETESGNSPLVKKSNNHFGIKCKSTWNGNGVSHDDDEKGECFRTYKDAEGSYRDHSNFLRNSERYSFLFGLNPADYKAWARGLKKAGYATDSKYPEILIRNIERYNLQQYTLLAAGEVPLFEKNKYEDDKEVPEDATAVNNENTVLLTNVTHINGNRCMYAAAGTSLLAIATSNDVQLSRLLEYNDLEEDGILKNDQIIFLEKKSKKGDQDFYVAKKGESLYDISQQTGVQLQYILTYNQLHKNSVPAPGTKIYLQYVKENSEVKETAAASAAAPKTYEVKPKDGLYAISKKFGVSVQQLKEWNHLNSDVLSIGQQLIVSE